MTRLPQPYQDEMRGISAATGIELGNTSCVLICHLMSPYFRFMLPTFCQLISKMGSSLWFICKLAIYFSYFDMHINQ